MSSAAPGQSTPTVFHYTSAPGLVGIIKLRQIWATGSNYLNDPTEVSFAAQALSSALRDRLAEEELPVARDALDLLERSYIDPNSAHLYREDRAYISSFSRSDQSLTLWRLYAGRNGFCVGFDEQRLLEWVGKELPQAEPTYVEEQEKYQGISANSQLEARIEDVAYGADHANRLLDELLTVAPQSGSPLETEARIRAVLSKLTGIKHPAYEDEREARLVVREFGHHAEDPGVRIASSGALVAYRKIMFPFEAVQSISMAPGANFAQQRQALNALMTQGGRGPYGHVEIREPSLPFVW